LLRSNKAVMVFCALLLSGLFATTLTTVAANQQSQPTPQQPTPPADSQKKDDSQKKQKNDKATLNPKNSKDLTAEQVAEAVIFVYGSRPVLEQIRRNGVERGRVTRATTDGKTENATYERRFVRGESLEKDKVRLDQKLPSMEYSLVFVEGRLWGLINGAAFTPRQDASTAFLAQHRQSIETLLRYKEIGATVNLVGKDKQKGLDLYVLDLIDKDKRSTRYYISAKSLHVLWLEYEDSSAPGATPIKYSKRFLDYRYSQSTLVPYRTVLFEDGKQTQETWILTVTFGIKVDEAVFKNPEA
jgi:hypothetical protein